MDARKSVCGRALSFVSVSGSVCELLYMGLVFHVVHSTYSNATLPVYHRVSSTVLCLYRNSYTYNVCEYFRVYIYSIFNFGVLMHCSTR